MPTPRLEHHYLRLLANFPAGEVTTTLQALADFLCCSKRYMRALLVKMQQRGWLRWQATPGRGHQAHLLLLRDGPQLLREKAERLLAEGDFAAAIALIADPQQLAAVLHGRLGHSISDDYQTLRVPYYRPMPDLLPGTPLRRSEQHLVRQVFSGLTRVSASGEATGDVAHGWRQQAPLRWRFFLRPGVLFHDGRLLTSEDVVITLRRCAQLPLFSHLQRVEAQGALSVVIELSQPDGQLPLLLTDTAALILPADYAERHRFSSLPVGSGPYRISANNDWHLQLHAFEHYFGLRGLLDEIEVIVLPDVAAGMRKAPPGQQAHKATWLSSSLSDLDYVSGRAAAFTGLPSEPLTEMFVEQGGYFLLCDSRAACWQDPEQRHWLREILHPERLLQRLVEPVRPLWVPATSLLPRWQQAGGRMATSDTTPQRLTLRLAYHDRHPEYPMLAEIMRQVLKEAGVNVQLLELDYQHWVNGDAQADLWLGTVNFARPEVWNVAAWLLSMPLLQQGIAGGDKRLQDNWREAWRSGQLSTVDLVQQVVNSGWLQPLFHHWMRLKGPDQAQNFHLNNLGWFDFSTSWIEPDDRG